MSQALELEGYDLNLEQNTSHHCTDLFGTKRLIVRRGMPFNLTLHVKSTMNFKPENSKDLMKDKSFTAELVPSKGLSSESRPLVGFPLHQFADETKCWSAVSSAGPAENTLLVSVTSPPDAPIGQYTLTLHQPDNEKICLGEFTLLFNPWCSQDAVYMPLEAERKEYVLETFGKIYRGTFKKITPLDWDFGQYDDDVLDICLKILDYDCRLILNPEEQQQSCRKDPVNVSRLLSAMINSNDDNGVLVGSWDEYPNGTLPWEWTGSGEILQQWNESGPVRYGQCWVFAAVACTVCRVLGIPCRVVTNFRSAHDSNANLSIDKVITVDGEEIIHEDSIWNFHVWVECWMRRPDLGSDFDGWQVVDPTPQETTEGVFCCGPASVKAIKNGDLTKEYDTPFVFAEVNADVVYWTVRPDGEKVKSRVKTASVGYAISTKAVGTDVRQDLTLEYKAKEGSFKERKVYEKAEDTLEALTECEDKEGTGLYIKIKLPKEMMMGKDFDVFAKIKNNYMDEDEVVQCKAVFSASAVSNNGKLGPGCGFSKEQVQLAKGEESSVPLKIKYEKYASAIDPERTIKLTVTTIDYKNFDYKTAVKIIVLDSPDIEIKLLGEARVNQPMAVELTLLNTLPETLQDCCFSAKGYGLTAGRIEARIDPVGIGEEAKARIEFKPTRAATCMLIVRFKSDKLSNIHNSLNIVVKKPLPSDE